MKSQGEPEDLKRQAAAAALALVSDGMVVGLGTGSTAKHLIDQLGAALAAGELRDVKGVPTSQASERQALALGIELVDLPPAGVDVAIDGMDEVALAAGRLDAVKGLGGALLREKIVACAARSFVLIGDDSKLVGRLGERSPLPVEIARFGWRRTLKLLDDLTVEMSTLLTDAALPPVPVGAGPSARDAGAHARLRLTGTEPSTEPFVSDNGGYVVDCYLGAGYDAPALAAALDGTAGVVGHGLFLGVASRAFLATSSGVTELLPGQTEAAPR